MLPDRLQKLCKTQKLRPLPWPDRTRRPLLTLWPSDSLVCPPGSEIRCSNSMSKKECEQACMVIGPFGQRTALIFRQIGRCGQSGRKKHAQWLMLSCLGTIQTPHMIVAALIAIWWTAVHGRLQRWTLLCCLSKQNWVCVNSNWSSY